MKLARAGDYCLSQEGPAAGVEDAAARGAITASSTADNMAHGANMAVDGSSNTFWVGGRLLSFLWHPDKGVLVWAGGHLRCALFRPAP
jgi:hypothetical protein